jgi:DNA-binding IclR family transcriptional regulator
MQSLPAQPNRSLLEGLEVLLKLAQRGDPVGVRELAREMGMTPTRVQRYLATLAHLGLSDRTETGRYGLGPGIHALSAMSLSASGLAGRAMSVLPTFSDLGLVVALGVLWRNTVNYLYFSVPGMAVSESLGRREGYPARESSIGMLMLSWQEDAFLDRHFPDDKAAILKAAPGIRKRGYAVVNQPSGDTSIAVPVGSPPMAGLALSGKLDPDSFPDLGKKLRLAADSLIAG